MVATSTHDTKRGEDTRAIIAAIADAPGEWSAAVQQWRTELAPDSDHIHPNDLYLFFQLLLGGWPIDDGHTGDLADRLKGAMIKAIREARERSDWGVNASAYERAVTQFVDHTLAHSAFLTHFQSTRVRLQAIGRRKGLIQAALKLTIPGVPDIYRGAEDWEQSFVDPDNRRRLDFTALAARLASPSPDRDDKLVLTQTLLRLRRRLPRLFAEGSYEPLDCGHRTLGFRRRLGGDEVLVLADLSARHEAGIAADPAGLRTVIGSAAGPIWILATP